MTAKSFTGGDKLKARLAEMSKKLEKAGTLRAGFLEGETYPDGVSVPMVAAVQEFGAPAAGIPPRPYFRPMIAGHSEEWGDIIAQGLPATGYDGARVLGAVGQTIKEELQQSIAEVDSPPLSDVTLMLRKMRSEDQSLVVTGRTVGEAARRVAEGEEIGSVNTKPLQDSGFMKDSVSFEVKT
jgi:hypothetical protein